MRWPAAPRPGWRNPASGPCACGGRRGSSAAARAGRERRGCRADRGGGRTAAGRCPRPDRRPPPSREPRRGRRAPARRAAGLDDQALELAGQGDGVPGREQQAPLAVAGQLLVDGQARGDRDRSGRERAANQPRSRRGPAGGDADDVGARDQLLGRRLARADGVDPVAQPARDADLVPVRQPDRRLPGEPQRQAPQRPQEEPQRAALLLKAEGDPHGPLGIGLRDRVGIRARGHQPSTSRSAPGVTSS